MTTRATRSPRRRTVIALGVVLAILAVFIVRLVDIQVVNAKENIRDSMAYGLSASQKLTGNRGTIVDSSGQTLAVSSLDYDCQFTPVNVGPVARAGADGKAVKVPWDEVADEIAHITGKTGDEVRAIVSDALATNARSQYALLGRGYTTEQYRQLASSTATASSPASSRARMPACPRRTARCSSRRARTGSSSPAPRSRSPR